MTRKEQIKQGIIEHYGELGYQSGMIRETFESAVKWADEHPKEGMVSLDKVCEYLDNVLYEVVSGVSSLPDVMSIENTTMEDFIKNFRKSMEDNI